MCLFHVWELTENICMRLESRLYFLVLMKRDPNMPKGQNNEHSLSEIEIPLALWTILYMHGKFRGRRVAWYL